MIDHRRIVLAAVCLSLLLGCGKKDPVRPAANQPMPDFTLVDENPNSATAGQNVSPRQKLGKISAWYFGHAT